MSLADWQKSGRLIEHRTSAREIADLLAVVERDLADSAAKNVSAGSSSLCGRLSGRAPDS